jgi:hypothetical protein
MLGYYFIGRCPKLFGIILNYLRYNTLNIKGKSKEELDLIFDEFEYYLIPFPGIFLLFILIFLTDSINITNIL